MANTTSTVTAFVSRYKIYPTISKTISDMIWHIERLLKYPPPETGKSDDGITLKVKKILSDFLETLNYYVDYKTRFVKAVKYFDATPMHRSLNTEFNTIIRSTSQKLREFELKIFEVAKSLLSKLGLAYAKYEVERETEVAGIGAIPIIITALIAAAVIIWKGISGYLEYQRIATRRDVLEYDLNTMETAENMKRSGVDDLEITSYIKSRTGGVDRTGIPDVTTYQNKYKTGTGTGLLQSVTGGGISPLMIAAIAAGLLLLTSRRR